MEKYKTIINQIDIEIKNANLVKSVGIFNRLYHDLSCKNRDFRLRNRSIYTEAAILARRLSLFREGIDLLRYYVYPKATMKITTSAPEKVEYASLLSRLGLFNEAQRLLDGVTSKDYVKAHLLKGFFWIAQWNHFKAIEELSFFIQQENIEEYDRNIAIVNKLLSHCFLCEWDQAELLAQNLLNSPMENKSQLLQANILEAMSDIATHSQRFEDAKQLIKMSENLLSDKKGLDFLLVQKQRIVIFLEQEGLTDEHLTTLKKIKKKFLELARYEVVRELDLITAYYSQNLNLALELFVKTPYEGFKRKIISYFPEIMNIEFFHLSLNEKLTSKKEPNILDAEKLQLQMPTILFRLFLTLIKNGYSLSKVEDIFNSLYPDQNYNYDSASDRVHQQFKRLRLFFKSHRIPIKVAIKKNRYYLSSTSHASVFVKLKVNHQYMTEREVKFKKYLLKERIDENLILNLPTQKISKLTRIHPRKIRRIKALKK